MKNTQHEWSRISKNRFAVAVVSGSVLLLGGLALLYWVGFIDQLTAMRPPEIASLPLYLIGVLGVLAIVVWSWRRLLSFFK